MFAFVAKMKLWMSVISLVIISRRVKIFAGAAPVPAVATCSLGQTTPTDVQSLLDGVRIECPQGTALQQVGSLVPSDSSNVEILTEVGGGAVPLRTLLPCGTYVRTQEGGVNVDTLRTSQLLEKPVQLYFECRHNNRAQSCYIQVNVLPAHRLGPNVCTEVGSWLHFVVRAMNEAVLFSCGVGFRLFPADPAKVYDGNCRNELHLDDVLPGSYVTHADDNGPNTLVVVYLPPPPQSMCYICAPPGSRPTPNNRCFVRVTTAAGSGEPPIPTNSVSTGLEVTTSTASVLGLILVGTGHLSIS